MNELVEEIKGLGLELERREDSDGAVLLSLQGKLTAWRVELLDDLMAENGHLAQGGVIQQRMRESRTRLFFRTRSTRWVMTQKGKEVLEVIDRDQWQQWQQRRHQQQQQQRRRLLQQQQQRLLQQQQQLLLLQLLQLLQQPTSAAAPAVSQPPPPPTQQLYQRPDGTLCMLVDNADGSKEYLPYRQGILACISMQRPGRDLSSNAAARPFHRCALAAVAQYLDATTAVMRNRAREVAASHCKS